MVVNVSPLAAHLGETVCSLRFATKVKCLERDFDQPWCSRRVVTGEQHDDWHREEAGKDCLVDVSVLLNKYVSEIKVWVRGRGYRGSECSA
jgi:hypothetical protein